MASGTRVLSSCREVTALLMKFPAGTSRVSAPVVGRRTHLQALKGGPQAGAGRAEGVGVDTALLSFPPTTLSRPH